MLFQQICNPNFPRRPAIITSRNTTSWESLSTHALELTEKFADLRHCRVGIKLPASASGVAALAALDHLGANAVLLDARLPTPSCLDLAQRLSLDTLLELPDERGGWRLHACREKTGRAQPGVTILTSGTEGVPKAARHTWESLSRPIRVAPDGQQQRWLLTYRVHLYAGLQVLLQGLANDGTLVMPSWGDAPHEIARMLVENAVEYASATPSYWRQLVLFADRDLLRRAVLKQITLGGEAIDQQILDSLRSVFPTARIAHIYATTELGRCFSVTDGLAGFPAEYLERELPDGVRLKIEAGQLYVQSANAMRGYDQPAEGVQGAEGVEGGTPSRSAVKDSWFATGDLVIVRDGRVYFAGRGGDMINVGGNKVQPLLVERVIRDVAGVADARVYGKSSSLAGQIVACDIVLAEGFAADDVKTRVQQRCLAELTTYQRPRLIHVVSRLDLSPAGKTKRQVE